MVHFKDVNIDDLIDLRDIHIDPKLPQCERQQAFIEQVKNPRLFKVGKVVVSVGYSNDGVTFEDRMEQYLSSI